MDIFDILKEQNAPPTKEAQEPASPSSDIEEMAQGLEKLAEAYLSPKENAPKVDVKKEDKKEDKPQEKSAATEESVDKTKKSSVTVDEIREELIDRIVASKVVKK